MRLVTDGIGLIVWCLLSTWLPTRLGASLTITTWPGRRDSHVALAHPAALVGLSRCVVPASCAAGKVPNRPGADRIGERRSCQT